VIGFYDSESSRATLRMSTIVT